MHNLNKIDKAFYIDSCSHLPFSNNPINFTFIPVNKLRHHVKSRENVIRFHSGTKSSNYPWFTVHSLKILEHCLYFNSPSLSHGRHRHASLQFSCYKCLVWLNNKAVIKCIFEAFPFRVVIADQAYQILSLVYNDGKV